MAGCGLLWRLGEFHCGPSLFRCAAVLSQNKKVGLGAQKKLHAYFWPNSSTHQLSTLLLPPQHRESSSSCSQLSDFSQLTKFPSEPERISLFTINHPSICSLREKSRAFPTLNSRLSTRDPPPTSSPFTIAFYSCASRIANATIPFALKGIATITQTTITNNWQDAPQTRCSRRA
jgi:hypothetical protein